MLNMSLSYHLEDIRVHPRDHPRSKSIPKKHLSFLSPSICASLSARYIPMHKKTTMSATVLPLGHMSEEAQAAKKEHLHLYREHYARESSNLNTKQGLLFHLLISRYRIIGSMGGLENKRRKYIPTEILDLLKTKKKCT